MDHLRFGKWTSQSFPQDFTELSPFWWIYFSHGLHVFSLDWDFPLYTCYWLFYGKVLLEKIITTWEIPLKFHGNWETQVTGQVFWQACAVCQVLQYFHHDYHPQFFGVGEHTDGIIKAHLAKFVETLQICWPKAMPLVLLNLRHTPLELNSHSLR